MLDLTAPLAFVAARRRAVPPDRSLLVGLSGIDGAGKGFVAAALAAEVEQAGLHVAVLNVDGWLNLPDKRFSRERPAEHFYEHALRLEDMFAQLVRPLRDKRAHRLVAQHAEETATEYRLHTYDFSDVDVVLVEGILLFKRAYRPEFDLALWVDCTFETALERAIARGQERLPLAETVAAYSTIYFPAQRLHIERDDPRTRADGVISNDPRLAAVRQAPSVLAPRTA